MLNVYFAVAANRVIVDSVTNQASIIDLFEHLKATTFPVLIPKLTLLFYVSRDNADTPKHDLTLVCELDGESIFDVSVKLDFKGEDTTRLVLGIDGLSLPKAGLLKAKLIDKKIELGALELSVEHVNNVDVNASQELRH